MKNQITNAHSWVTRGLAIFALILISLSSVAQSPGGGHQGGNGGGPSHGGPSGGGPNGGGPGGWPHGGGPSNGGHHWEACNAHFSHFRDSIVNGIQFHNIAGSGAATYAWDFGDGNTSSSASPSNTYTAEGTYYVCLTVTDTVNGGCTDTWCDSVRVFTPAPHCNAHFRHSLDTIPNGVRFNSSYNSAGATYAWDFGDGSTSSLEDPAHAYAADGMYYVCLTVTNSNAGGTCSDSWCDSVHAFTPAPHCNAAFFHTLDTIDNGVRFYNSHSSAGATYAWDFGDGSNSSSEDPAHVYAAAGTYYVCLTVTNSNAGGTCSDSWCDSVHAFTPMPYCNAHFNYNPDTVANGVRFHGAHSSHGATYAWDFGDGNSSSDPNPTNLYSAAGTYYVCLTVTNSNSAGTCSDTWCDSVNTAGHSHGGPGGGHHNVVKLGKQSSAPSTEVYVSLYPNPMTESSVLHIENTSGNVVFRAYDRTGRIAFSKNVTNGDFQIGKENLSEGIYYYTVEDNGTSVSKGKLIVY